MAKKTAPKTKEQQQPVKNNGQQPSRYTDYLFPRKLMSSFAEEVAQIVISRLPYMSKPQEKGAQMLKDKKIEHAMFLDTSAIIDGRIFTVINLGLFHDTFVVPEGVLLELKHIADSQDVVRRERGRKGLEALEGVKKQKDIKLLVVPDESDPKETKRIEVDEMLIRMAKSNKGRIITCDYNLEKKAAIQNVTAVNMNALAQCLKVSAVPGEALHIKLLHVGKELTQAVGYLDDGTMIVVEHAASDVGSTVDVVVSRVIQTNAGKILFAKKIA